MTDTQYLSVTQCAAALGISRQRVLVLVAEGRIPATRVGSYWVINKQDLAEFLIKRITAKLLNDGAIRELKAQED